jgi:hypothetical protein
MLAWFGAVFAIGLGSLIDWSAWNAEQAGPAAAATPQPVPAQSAPAAREVPHQREVRPPEPQQQAVASGATNLPADPELGGHPHPITAEHVRIQRELALIQQLNDALDLRDAAHLRALIAEYVQHVPDDPNALAAGYERIADCLEHPDAATRDRAREYYLRERASTLRRYVRRVCFDDAPVEAAKL